MGLYKKLFDIFERNYLMYAMFGVLLSSSLGAVGAMLAFRSSEGIAEMIQVGLLVIGCCGFTAALLGGQKPKVVFNWLVVSIIISTIIVVIQVL